MVPMSGYCFCLNINLNTKVLVLKKKKKHCLNYVTQRSVISVMFSRTQLETIEFNIIKINLKKNISISDKFYNYY